jgi:hypothetical protein
VWKNASRVEAGGAARVWKTVDSADSHLEGGPTRTAGLRGPAGIGIEGRLSFPAYFEAAGKAAAAPSSLPGL